MKLKSLSRLRIFICYRRDDAGGYAGRLRDALVRRLGEDNVLMDLASLRPGDAFRSKLQNMLAQCDVMLVIIGRFWLTLTDKDGCPRVDSPDDFVCREIAMAFASEKRIIPVLVQGAMMPGRDELPAHMQFLEGLNALSLDDKHWTRGIQDLLHELGFKQKGSATRWVLTSLACTGSLVIAVFFWKGQHALSQKPRLSQESSSQDMAVALQYLTGADGRRKNYDIGAKCYAAALRHGDPIAIGYSVLSECFDPFFAQNRCYPTSSDREAAFASVVPQLAALARSGNADAMLLYSLAYEKGIGIVQNEIERARWLDAAVDSKHTIAMVYKAFQVSYKARANNTGMESDPPEAQQLYREAIKSNLPFAKCFFATLHRGSPESIALFKSAADQGDAGAMLELANESARGNKLDEAMSYLDRASSLDDPWATLRILEIYRTKWKSEGSIEREIVVDPDRSVEICNAARKNADFSESLMVALGAHLPTPPIVTIDPKDSEGGGE